MKFGVVNDRGSNIPNLWVCCELGFDASVISNNFPQITIKIMFQTKLSRIMVHMPLVVIFLGGTYGLICCRYVILIKHGL